MLVAKALAAGLLMLIPGLAWAAWLPHNMQGRVLLGPLLGISTTAWVIEVAYYFGLPTGTAAALVIVASAALAAARLPLIVAERRAFRYMATFYAAAFSGSLLAVSLTVWPAAGPWSVDWFVVLQQLQAMWRGEPFKEWLLARPPLFAAAALPSIMLFEPLPALQVGACAFAAAAFVALRWLVGALGAKPPIGNAVLAVIGLSMFYLVNLTAMVPKLVQGALIVAAFAMLKDISRDNWISRIGVSALLMCLAVEAHHSTVAYGIAYLAALWYVQRNRQIPLRSVFICLGVLVTVVILPELARVLRFGIDEIIRFNPSVAMRSARPGWVVFLLNLESEFVGWGYLFPLWNMYSVGREFSAETVGYYANWFVIMHQGMMSNTMALILLPFVFTVSRLKAFLSFAGANISLGGLACLATIPVVVALLHPYEIANGIVHAGLTAVAIGSIALGIAWLSIERVYMRATLAFTMLTGTAWWIGWNAIQHVIVARAGGIGGGGKTLETDLDRELVIESAQLPFGNGSFPFLSLVLTLVTAVCVALAMRWEPSERDNSHS